MNLGRRTRLALAVVVFATAGAGCATPAGPRNPSGEVTATAGVDVFSLQVGDCTGPVTTGTANQLTLIPCEQPHSWEVFAATELEGEEFPGAGEVQDLAEEFCNAEFKAFIGLSVGKSSYNATILQPTKQTWNSAGDRTVTCLVGRDDGEIEGSLKDAEKK